MPATTTTFVIFFDLSRSDSGIVAEYDGATLKLVDVARIEEVKARQKFAKVLRCDLKGWTPPSRLLRLRVVRRGVL